MSTYSVLLVDDEEEVINVIMKKLDWESLGFHIAGYAKNGVEALDMAEELKVDVVMTDIKMPYMDGLTLAKKLKEQYKNIKVIIFSGFDEFEYAREAIKIEAEEYILKPINSDELETLFKRIKKSLDEELDAQRNIDLLKAYYDEALPMLRDHFFISLLDGCITRTQFERHMSDYKINFNAEHYLATILHVTTPDESEELDQTLLSMAVRRMAEDELKGRDMCHVVPYLGDIVVITGMNRDDLKDFTDTMDMLCKLAKRVCNATVTAGIGYLCDELIQLPTSFAGARNAVSYRALYGTGRAINISEIDPMEESDTLWEESYIDDIVKKIKMGQEQPLYESINQFMDRLENTRMTIQKYQIIIMEIVTEIFRLGVNNQVDMESLVEGDTSSYAKNLASQSPETFKRWLFTNCSSLMLKLNDKRKNSSKSFAETAIEYVRDHYADTELGIDSMCSELNVSAAYFSTMFKKETGKTFINYLTDYRMLKAADLLLQGNDKTYIIAEKVGYSDPNYFSYAFKKQYGISPSKYRAGNQE